MVRERYFSWFKIILALDKYNSLKQVCWNIQLFATRGFLGDLCPSSFPYDLLNLRRVIYIFKTFFKLVNTELFLSPEPKTKLVISTSKVKIKRYSEGQVEIKDRNGRKERKEMYITHLLYSCGYLAKFTNLFTYLFIYLFIYSGFIGRSKHPTECFSSLSYWSGLHGK